MTDIEIIPPLVPVESSNLAAVGYAPATATLYVEFLGGGLYAYSGVPADVHAGLMAAESKGAYLSAAVKVKGANGKLVYPYRKLTAGEPQRRAA